MNLNFLGTASGYPSPTKGTSSIALRYDGEVWLIDCGEGTQTQIMKLKLIKPRAITKIFITHLHGDHIFGLPGLLCTISMCMAPAENSESSSSEPTKTVEIYGPYGLRRYLRECLSLSQSRLEFNYVVHELHPINEQFQTCPDLKHMNNHSCSESSLHVCEASTGRNIICDEKNLCWNLFSDGPVIAQAGALIHRVPCFGYVFTEKDKPGSLLSSKLIQFGVPKGKLFGQIKNGQAVTLADGRVVDPDQFVGPPIPGRKIAILQDTCDSSLMVDLCLNCDVLVHESTNEEANRQKCVENGHSTPVMAAQFALRTNSKMLILTHVSQRYKHRNCQEVEEDDKTSDILQEEAQNLLNSQTVLCAYDGLVIPVTTTK